jgi:hypothetical protein
MWEIAAVNSNASLSGWICFLFDEIFKTRQTISNEISPKMADISRWAKGSLSMAGSRLIELKAQASRDLSYKLAWDGHTSAEAWPGWWNGVRAVRERPRVGERVLPFLLDNILKKVIFNAFSHPFLAVERK